MKGKDKESGQEIGSIDSTKKNHFYVFLSRGEQEISPDVVTGMLKVFYVDVYALLIRSLHYLLLLPL